MKLGIVMFTSISYLFASEGDKINVMTLFQPRDSPHSYEPKPSQMKMQ